MVTAPGEDRLAIGGGDQLVAIGPPADGGCPIFPALEGPDHEFHRFVGDVLGFITGAGEDGGQRIGIFSRDPKITAGINVQLLLEEQVGRFGQIDGKCVGPGLGITGHVGVQQLAPGANWSGRRGGRRGVGRSDRRRPRGGKRGHWFSQRVYP